MLEARAPRAHGSGVRAVRVQFLSLIADCKLGGAVRTQSLSTTTHDHQVKTGAFQPGRAAPGTYGDPQGCEVRYATRLFRNLATAWGPRRRDSKTQTAWRGPWQRQASGGVDGDAR